MGVVIFTIEEDFISVRNVFIIGEKINIPLKLQEFMKGEKKSLSLSKDFETFKSYLMNLKD